jgi:4-amino-4-deoxy-L-arabinose transferase-like glycosyltransferase
MSSIPIHVALLGTLAVAAWLPGYALERALWRGRDLEGLRALARICTGLLFWMACLFALASCGWLVAPAIYGVSAASALAATAAHLRFRTAPRAIHGADLAFIAATLVFTSPLFFLSLDPQVSWDAGAYHLALPRRYIEAGGFVPVAMNVYSNWPLATELLFAAAMLVGDHVVAKGVHFVFGVLTLWSVYVGCRTFHRRAAGWLAAPLVLANPILLFEFSIAYVDLAYAFFFTAALLFMVFALERRSRAALLLSGLCGAALVGIKITGVMGVGAVGALAVPAVVSALRARDGAPLRDVALLFAAPALAAGLPWLAKSAAYTGNPVYPFLYDVFGGPDWSASLSVQLRVWLESFGMGRDALDFVRLPLRVALSSGGPRDPFQGDLGDFWVALVPLAAVLGWRQRLARHSLAAAAVYFAAWSVGSQQARFLIPVLPLLAMAAGVALVEGTSQLRADRLRAAALGAAMVGAVALVAAYGHRPFAAGLARPRDAHARVRPAAHPIYGYVARELPRDARILLLDTNQTFFLERDHLADSFFEASQIADWLRPCTTPDCVEALLALRGVSHVLVDRGRRWGIRWPKPLTALLRDASRAERLHGSGDGRFELFALRAARREAPGEGRS